jgi:hypothetical protein
MKIMRNTTEEMKLGVIPGNYIEVPNKPFYNEEKEYTHSEPDSDFISKYEEEGFTLEDANAST